MYLTDGSLVARPDARLGEPGEELPGRESRDDLAVLGEGDAGGGDPAARVVGHHVRRVVLVHGQAAVRVPHVEAEARHGDRGRKLVEDKQSSSGFSASRKYFPKFTEK